MGTKSSKEIEKEIDVLRMDTDRVLAELESRFRDALNLRAQAERHPFASGTIGLLLLGGLGITAYAVYSATTHRPSPRERLFELKREPEMTRQKAGEEGKRAEGVVKRILWTFLTTLLVTTAGFAARRLSATLWARTMREQPPSK